MVDPSDRAPEDQGQPPPETGPERRSGIERRQNLNPQPPAGLGERRRWVRRKADRLSLEKGVRFGPSGGGRLNLRVPIEVPVLYRALAPGVPLDQPAQRGLTRTLGPGGLGLLLAEEFPPGTALELLVRVERDLLGADVHVVSVVSQDGQFLHNCRFTRLGEADRNWLAEYLHLRGVPPIATRE